MKKLHTSGDVIMARLCKELNIKLIDVSLPENKDHVEANSKDLYVDGSYTAGNEIYLGIYKNKEWRLISFFHELGHILPHQNNLSLKNTKFEFEVAAWYTGLEYARGLDIHFSDDALEWGYKQALTYIGYNKREVSNWRENYSE